MNESNCDEKFNPDDYRDALKRYPLENSKDRVGLARAGGSGFLPGPLQYYSSWAL
ncbi:Hypothetical protein CINCED_3A013963, partial [Cinara cedri]